MPPSTPDHPERDDHWTSRRMPTSVYERLRHGFVRSVAGELVDTLTTPPSRTPQPQEGRPALSVIGSDRHDRPVAHPGDPFGVVVAWLWASNRNEVPELLADLLADLRHHGPHAGKLDPPITLDELLEGLHFAMPSGFSAHEYDQLVQLARTDVPSYFSTDPNSREV